MRRGGFFIVALVSGVLTSCGPSKDRPPEVGDQGSVPGHPDPHGSGTDDGGTTDAAPSGTLAVTDGGTCATLTASTLVTQQQVAAPTPEPLGGTFIPAGVYVLTAMNKYTGIGGNTGPTSKVQAQVWQFDASTYQRATAGQDANGGVGAPFLDSGTYALSGKTFSPSATCGVGNIPVSYSVESPGLKLSFLDEEYVFTRQ